MDLKETLLQFENGEERYKMDSMFHHTINSIVRGGDILREVGVLIDAVNNANQSLIHHLENCHCRTVNMKKEDFGERGIIVIGCAPSEITLQEIIPNELIMKEKISSVIEPLVEKVKYKSHHLLNQKPHNDRFTKRHSQKSKW